MIFKVVIKTMKLIKKIRLSRIFKPNSWHHVSLEFEDSGEEKGASKDKSCMGFPNLNCQGPYIESNVI